MFGDLIVANSYNAIVEQILRGRRSCHAHTDEIRDEVDDAQVMKEFPRGCKSVKGDENPKKRQIVCILYI